MTAVVDDPLIAGMVIRRVLPLHSRAAGCGGSTRSPPASTESR